MRRARIPNWAHRERLVDMAWIAEHLDAFWNVAKTQHLLYGRGVLFVNTTVTMPGAGHPIQYLPQLILSATSYEDAKRMVREYRPTKEVIVVILKKKRVSTYRVQARL